MVHLKSHGKTYGQECRTYYTLGNDKHLAEPHLVFYFQATLHHVYWVEPRHDNSRDDAANKRYNKKYCHGHKQHLRRKTERDFRVENVVEHRQQAYCHQHANDEAGKGEQCRLLEISHYHSPHALA